MGFLEFLVKFGQVWPTFPSTQQKVPGLGRAKLVEDTTGQVPAWPTCADPGLATGTQGMGMWVPYWAGTGVMVSGTPQCH